VAGNSLGAPDHVFSSWLRLLDPVGVQAPWRALRNDP